MQTCKELKLICCLRPRIDFSTKLPSDPIDPSAFFTHQIVIPSGTYVRKVFDRWNPTEKMYKVQGWRGMPKHYKESINSGVLLTHAQVKGKI